MNRKNTAAVNRQERCQPPLVIRKRKNLRSRGQKETDKIGSSIKRDNSPMRSDNDTVQILAASLAEILVRTRGLFHDADAAAVLPDLALIALDEQAAGIVRLSISPGARTLAVAVLAAL